MEKVEFTAAQSGSAREHKLERAGGPALQRNLGRLSLSSITDTYPLLAATKAACVKIRECRRRGRDFVRV